MGFELPDLSLRVGFVVFLSFGLCFIKVSLFFCSQAFVFLRFRSVLLTDLCFYKGLLSFYLPDLLRGYHMYVYIHFFVAFAGLSDVRATMKPKEFLRRCTAKPNKWGRRQQASRNYFYYLRGLLYLGVGVERRLLRGTSGKCFSNQVLQ